MLKITSFNGESDRQPKKIKGQVAIAGRVVTGEPQRAVSGAVVEIIAMPKKFQTQLAIKSLQDGSQWGNSSLRLERKISTSEGYFYFVDLPVGEYTLAASITNRSSSMYGIQKKIIVKQEKSSLRIITTFQDIYLSPVEIEGQMRNKDDPNSKSK